MLAPGYDVQWQPLLRQLIGILQLDDATYRDIKLDESATDTSVSVVTIGMIFNSLPILLDTDPFSFALGASLNIVLKIGAWLIGSFVIFLVASYILKRRSTSCRFLQYLRLSGFAHAAWWLSALFLLAVIDPVSFLTTSNWVLAAGVVICLWSFACSVKAIMCAFDFGILRAIGTHTISAALTCATVLVVFGEISLGMIIPLP